jgi:molybdopterin converting factor subunit 1
MNIRLRYFASLREVIGQSDAVLTLPEGTRVADVRALLLERYPGLRTVMERVLSAVNKSYVPFDTELYEGDELAFIPPMGGGL